MSAVITPEHLQLLSHRHLKAVIAAPERVSETDEAPDGMARMARYELRRRQCDVPVRRRYDCVAKATDARTA